MSPFPPHRAYRPAWHARRPRRPAIVLGTLLGLAGIATVVGVTGALAPGKLDLAVAWQALTHPGTQPDAGPALMRAALGKARKAGSYVLDIELDQAVAPVDPFGVPQREEWTQLGLRGEVAGPDGARFAIRPRQTSFVAQGPALQEILIQGDAVYTAEGERWVKAPSAPSTLAVDPNGPPCWTRRRTSATWGRRKGR
jgi:hypothetical protein